MSTARFDTLTGSAGGNSMTVASINQGRAKAWCNFSGTGVIAIRDTFGVSSLADAGVGTYIANTTTSRVASTAAAVSSAINIGVGGAFVSCYQQYVDGITHLTYLSSAPNTPADVPLISTTLTGNQL